jgi:hypothetical protein
MRNDEMNKWCPKCQQYLSRDQFYRNVAQSDGLAPYCKPCWREFCRVRHARLREGMQDKRRGQQREETKRCTRCQEVKPVLDFYKSDQWIDGLHLYCKKCVLAYQRAARESKLAQFPGKYRWKRDLIRHDYFAQIDSPIKAYVLGVLAADGNVLPKHHRITLELSARDADLLETVRDELVPGGAIVTRHRNGYDYQVLAFVSRNMVNDLEALGVTAVKSRTITWPERLPSSFAREFILGYFDGDGFITYHERPNRRYPYIGFTSGSFNLLVSIADVIEQCTGIRPSGPWGKGITGGYSIRVSGNSAFIIDEWLHASGLGLKRKRPS